ncbi:hypothetical protein H8D30_03045 [bacterium]|nr:hypothetical protein [bacterium]
MDWRLTSLTLSALILWAIAWGNDVGADAVLDLFQPGGSPRMARVISVSLWDDNKKVAKLDAQTVVERGTNQFDLEGIENALFYRHYEPYVTLSAPGAIYDDAAESLQFRGPFTATTTDGIVATSESALWTRRSRILAFPRPVSIATDDVLIEGTRILFDTEDDRVVMTGPWHILLRAGTNRPSLSGGGAIYNTQEKVLLVREVVELGEVWDPAIATAKREPLFRALGPMAPPGRPHLRSRDWDLGATLFTVDVLSGGARMTGGMDIGLGGQDDRESLTAPRGEFWWEAGYADLEGPVVWDKGVRHAEGDRAFLDRDKDEVRLEGNVTLFPGEGVLENEGEPYLSAGKTEIESDPEIFRASEGFIWEEGMTLVAGDSVVWFPEENRLVLEGGITYLSRETTLETDALRLSRESARFAGEGRFSQGDLVAQGQDGVLNRNTDALTLRNATGSLDGNPFEATFLERLGEKEWSFVGGSISPSENLTLDGDLQIEESSSTGTVVRGGLSIGEVRVSSDSLSFGWNPATALCSQSCGLDSPQWVGETDWVEASEGASFSTAPISLSRRGDWLGVGGVSLSSRGVLAEEGNWVLEQPVLSHPDWTVSGEKGRMPEEGDSLTILGQVRIEDNVGKRTVRGERWLWENTTESITVEGNPTIEGEKTMIRCHRLLYKDDLWHGEGPIDWIHQNEIRSTSLQADQLTEEKGGYLLEGNVEMVRGDVTVQAGLARLRTSAETIIFQWDVVVLLKDGTKLSGERFLFDLDEGKGVLDGGASGVVVVD